MAKNIFAKKENKETFSATLEPRQIKEITRLSEKHDCSRSVIIGRLIDVAMESLETIDV